MHPVLIFEKKLRHKKTAILCIAVLKNIIEFI
jgi:hypothetical protein